MADLRARTAQRIAILTGSVESKAGVLRILLRQDAPCQECEGRGWGRGAREKGRRDTYCATDACGRCAGTGAVFRPRVELAACCGDEAAVVAVQVENPCPHSETIGCSWCDLGRLLGALVHFADIGPAPAWVIVQAAVAAAKVACEAWEKQRGWKWNGRGWDHAGASLTFCNRSTGICDRCRAPRLAIEAAETWLRCPSEAHGLALEAHGGVPIRRDGRPTADMWWAGTVGSAFRAFKGYTSYEGMGWPEQPFAAIEACASIAGDAPVHAGIHEALIGWALGGQP